MYHVHMYTLHCEVFVVCKASMGVHYLRYMYGLFGRFNTGVLCVLLYSSAHLKRTCTLYCYPTDAQSISDFQHPIVNILV